MVLPKSASCIREIEDDFSAGYITSRRSAGLYLHKLRFWIVSWLEVMVKCKVL